MAKFCTKCGKKLEEGKVCECESKETVNAVAAEKNGFDVKECANSYLDMLKGIFTKPVDTVKEYATASNFLLGVIAIALNSIISGLLIYFVCKEAIGSIAGMFGMGMYSFGTVEVPFFKTFLYGFIFMAVWFAVMALMVYVIANVILKDKIDIKKAFALVGVCSVFTAATTLVAIVCTFISMKIMSIVLLIAAVFYLTYLYQGISEVTEVEKNKLAYVFVPSLTVAIFVVVYILPKILF